MKKYQQLMIVSLGLVSFICFLIYKHEYDRLRNVLEVLEVFGTPSSQAGGAVAALRSHPLDVNHNPALGAGSINELNLGGGGVGAYDAKQDPAGQQQFDDAFVIKNGHGVRPPDNDGQGGDQVMAGNKNQNPVQNSGEVVDNLVEDRGGLGKFGGLKGHKKVSHHQDSIFSEKRQNPKKAQDNEV